MKQRSVLKVTLTERFAEQLKTVIFAIFVLNVLDGILTIVGVTTGTAVEANPLMANLISYHPVHGVRATTSWPPFAYFSCFSCTTPSLSISSSGSISDTCWVALLERGLINKLGLILSRIPTPLQ